jgi:uncharacterized protein YjbJ (UPF0337 family)
MWDFQSYKIEGVKKAVEFEGNWNEIKGKLMQKFAVLTSDDVLLEKGKKEEILGKIQVKLGKTKEELEKVLSEL